MMGPRIDRKATPWASRPKLGRFKLRTGSRPLKTHGYLRGCEVGFVYVGISKSGRVKVGMSAAPEKRCESLKIHMIHAQPVVASVAKEVEQAALGILGKRQHEGEWGSFTPEEAIRAVREAYDRIGRARRVDPSLTEDEARALRAKLDNADSRVRTDG